MASAGKFSGSHLEEMGRRPGSNGRGGDPTFGEHREVTALCYDLADSTKLLAHSDIEDFQDVIAAFQERTIEAVRAHGGTVRETLGDDGGMGFFGFPVAMEDSAAAAIRAGLEVIQACKALAIERGQESLHVRVGIATSDVVVQEGHRGVGATVVGFAPIFAARLQAIAPLDTVVVSDGARRDARRHFAFRYLGARVLKGMDQEHSVWSVARRNRYSSRFVASGRLGARIVGREPQLQSALQHWERAVAGEGQVLVVEGEAGIGKSRFLHEILRRTRATRGRVLLLQCSPRASNSAFAPLADLVRAAAGTVTENRAVTLDQVAELMQREGIHDDLVIRSVAFAAGAAVSSVDVMMNPSPERIRKGVSRAVRRCVDALTKAGPVILALEDLHWIDPSSRHLIDDLAVWVRKKPVLLLMTTREATWPLTGTHVSRIVLDPLEKAHAHALLHDLWAKKKAQPLPPTIVALVEQRTNRVPLFMEELCQWLVATPSTEWVKLLSSARISSFEKLLSQRLAALGPAKTVAQAAAVIGREFDRQLLQAVLPLVPEDRLSTALARLVEANILVETSRGESQVHAFRHSLLQETLYGTLLRKSRTDLHRQIYAYVTKGPATGSHMDAIALGEHAEYGGLLKEAAHNYTAAAKESSARSAMAEARRLLEHSLQILERAPADDERERLELSALATLGPVLTSTQGTRSPEACRLYERAVEIARRRPAHEQSGWFPVYWGWWYTGGDFSIQRQRAQTVMADLHEVADPEVQLQVQHCLWAIDFNMGRHETCITAVNVGLALYQADRWRDSTTLYGGHDARVCGLGQRGLSLWFKGFPTQAVASVQEAARWANEIGHIGSIAHAYDIAAMLHYYRRDFSALEEVTAVMERLADKHELRELAAKVLIFDGWRISALGDSASGQRTAEQGFAILREIVTREDFPVYSGMLAEIVAKQAAARIALDLIDEAVGEAKHAGHLYWLPELYRRRAVIGAEAGVGFEENSESINQALRTSLKQNAMRLFLGACETAINLGMFERIGARCRAAIRPAIASIERGGETENLIAAIECKLDNAAR